MRSAPTRIEEVVAQRLCSGCGSCAYLYPNRFEMIDTLEHGRVPLVKPGSAEPIPAEPAAIEVCPGVELSHDPEQLAGSIAADLLPAWGPIISLWEGHASDPELRFAASSGGAASALALHAIERRGHHGLCHIDARPDVPYLNQSVLSRSREKILAATGSRYAPASPCEALNQVEEAPAACVFIGKPCDVAAARKARALRPSLDEKLGLTIAIFCAGTPSLQGTLEMFRVLGVSNPDDVESVRYRGRGWPGNAVVVFDGDHGKQSGEMSYADSWGGILQRFRLWRCRICADHSGEFADIAVGDPWYREIAEGEAGSSLILVRTPRGLEALETAIADGYVEAQQVENRLLPASQRSLLVNRGAIWGRLWTLWALGVPTPRYSGMSMFPFWWRILSPAEKARSILGTARRIYTRKLRERSEVSPYGHGNS